jgi:hypothetical protein
MAAVVDVDCLFSVCECHAGILAFRRDSDKISMEKRSGSMRATLASAVI